MDDFTESEKAAFKTHEQLRKASEFAADDLFADEPKAITALKEILPMLAEEDSEFNANRHKPIAPLLKLARVIGVETLRHLELHMRRLGMTDTIIEIRKRQDSEYRDKGKRRKQLEQRMDDDLFAHKVLKAERGGKTREAAFIIAGISADRKRTAERKMKRFSDRQKRQGFILTSYILHRGKPEFPLGNLVRKTGRRNSDK